MIRPDRGRRLLVSLAATLAIGACAAGAAQAAVGGLVPAPSPANDALNPATVVVSPDGRFVYELSPVAAAAGGGNFDTILADASIHVFSRDATTGALTFAGCTVAVANATIPATAGCSPFSSGGQFAHDQLDSGGQGTGDQLAISPDGRSLYAAVGATPRGGVRVFDLNPTTGLPTANATSPCVAHTAQVIQPETLCRRTDAISGSVEGIVVSPDGKHVYVASRTVFSDNGLVGVFRRDADGTLSNAGRSSCVQTGTSDLPRGLCTRVPGLQAIKRIVIAPDGRTIYAMGKAIATLTRDQVSGALTPISPTPGGGTIVTLPCLRSLDDSETPGCAPTSAITETQDIQISPDGQTVFVSARLPSGTAVLRRFTRQVTGRLVPASGLAAQGPTTLTSNRTGAIAVAPDGRTVYVEGTLLNPVSGVPAPRGFLVLDRDADGRLSLLPGTEGCVTVDGTGGVCTAAPIVGGEPSAFALSPDGRSLYSVNTGQGIRSGPFGTGVFTRTPGAPLTPPVVGVPRLAPRTATLVAGEPGTLTVTWSHPRRWSDLDAVLLRLSDARGEVVTFFLDQETLRLSLVGGPPAQAGGPPSRLRPLGGAGTLVRGRVVVILSGSSAEGSGVRGKVVTLELKLVLGAALRGRTLTAELGAQEDSGRAQAFQRVGTVRVR